MTSLKEDLFQAEMIGKRYGAEETKDAEAWFNAGWAAAIRASQAEVWAIHDREGIKTPSSFYAIIVARIGRLM